MATTGAHTFQPQLQPIDDSPVAAIGAGHRQRERRPQECQQLASSQTRLTVCERLPSSLPGRRRKNPAGPQKESHTVKNDIHDLLRQVIELQHGGRGTYMHTVKVHKMPPRPGQWDGAVHVFSLAGNQAASLAYAWAGPIDGSDSSRYFAVLHQGEVKGPVEAVSAVVKAIRAAA